MTWLTDRLGDVSRAMGLDTPRKDPPELDVATLPWMACRGVPKEILVSASGDDYCVPLSRVVRNVSTLCRHLEGHRCGLCEDARLLSAMVAECGVVRLIPAS